MISTKDAGIDTTIRVTPAQLRVLQALADYDGNHDIVAEKLALSVNTVRTHIDHMRWTLFPENPQSIKTLGLVMKGLRLGLIKLNDVMETN